MSNQIFGGGEDDLPPPQYFAVRDHKGNLVPHEQMVQRQQKQQSEQARLRRSWEARIADLQAARDAGQVTEQEFREQREMMESIRTSLQTEVPGRRGIISSHLVRAADLLSRDEHGPRF